MNEEFEFAENVKNEIRVIKNNTEPYTLYCAIDIGKTLNLKNIRASIQKFDNKYLINIKDNLKRNQKTTFITYDSFIKLLLLSRNIESINFCKKNNCLKIIERKKILCVESETINHIKTVFKTEEIICQYFINNYRIDLYFPKYNLCIECDEEQHRQEKNVKYDIERENKIKKINPKISFIRYSPYDKSFNIFEVIGKIYNYIINYDIKNINIS